MPKHQDLVERITRYEAANQKPQYVDRYDSWANSLTGIGTNRDKITSTSFSGDGCLPFGLIEDLFHNDDVSGRICSMLPELALGQDFELKDTKLLQEMQELGACEALENAAVIARAHGGAGIVMGMSDNNTASPAAGDVQSLMVLDRWSLWVKQYYAAGPKFGQPEIYTISAPLAASPLTGNTVLPQGAEIHESRLIVFPGARTTPRKKYANNYWDDSVLQRCYKVIEGYGITWASITHLLADAAQGVIQIKDLWAMLLSDAAGEVVTRLKTLDEQRSSGRSMVLDKDNEEFKRIQTPFTSIPELIDRQSERLASAAETPLTILMGSSPAGMNATGQSDLEIWYGKGRKWRTRVATPKIQKLAATMHPSAAPAQVKFPPFWLPTAKEMAETDYSEAQADQVYMLNRVFTPQEVRDKRAERYNVEIGSKVPPPIAVDQNTGQPATPDGSVVNTRHFSPKYQR